jgi:hypothetical protein
VLALFQQPPREARFDRDRREAVAQHVVQVAGHPLTFGRHRERGQLLARGAQLSVDPDHAEHADLGDADRRRADHVSRGERAREQPHGEHGGCGSHCRTDRPPAARHKHDHANDQVGDGVTAVALSGDHKEERRHRHQHGDREPP